MVSWTELDHALQEDSQRQLQVQGSLNLYDSPQLERLATQAIAGRQLTITALPVDERGDRVGEALAVCLCEDDYPGWVALEDLDLLAVAEAPYQPIALTPEQISDRLAAVLSFAQAAMGQPNHYLWGGTVGPNYDCSGLVQTAFAAADIWLPRDAYQQEAFVQAIARDEMQPGDLIFFGSSERCTHVALALDSDRYLHSSGKDIGRNGIGIDTLGASDDPVSQAYGRQLRGIGRVVACYTPVRSRP